MAIALIKKRSALSAIRSLEDLIRLDHINFVFRGHQNAGWKLQSTLARHTAPAGTELAIRTLDETLKKFYTRLASVGKLPKERIDRRTALEYARHHGVPSPLIDFSYSPYIALWMAFNGVRWKSEGHAAVYALNLSRLGILWQKHTQDASAFDRFRWSERERLFKDGFPRNALQAVLLPASWNSRMQRQMGLFIYDSLRYPIDDCNDLEDFIKNGVETPGPDNQPAFTLYKVIVPHAVATEIFERLDLMGIDGTRLFDHHEGAAADIINERIYNSRVGFTHDLTIYE